MLTYITITGTFNYRTTPTKTPAAGEVIEFVPRTAARPDGSEVLLPKTLSTTLNNSGQIPFGFSLPTLPGGVYYTVRETFEGGRGKYTILVNPGDPTTDLSDVAPVVPPPLLVSTRGPVGPPGPQPPLSNQVPAALGTAAPGTGTKAAREDHIHAMPTAAQVGADTAGAATGAVIAHEAAADPHPQYTTAAEAAAAAPVQTVAGRSGNVVLAVVDVANAVDTADARLSDAREWTASTVTQVEAEAGTDTSRKAWSVLRVWQAIAAWWAASSAKAKLDGIAAGAEVNVNADWNAGSGDAQILNKPTLGTAAAKDVPASGDAAATEVVKGDDSRLSDARMPTAHTHQLSELQQSGATANQVPQWDGTAWVPATVSGGGGSPSVRSASGSAGGGSTYVYMGNAANGTLDSAGAWTITRLTVDGGGGLTATTHATSNPSSVWNDYASLTYT